MGDAALLVQTSARHDELVDALIAAEGGLDGVLRGHVRAQAHGSEDVQPFQVVPGALLGAAHHHPAAAKAGHPIGFGEAVEGDGQHVVRKRRQRLVDGVVVDDLVVDFVGELHQVAVSRPVADVVEDGARIHRAGGIVGVDDDDAAAALGGLGADVVEVRLPVGAFVAAVVDGDAARQPHRGRPKGIVGCGNEHFVAVVQQCLHAHADEFADAVADDDVVDVHAGDAEPLALLHHRLARRKDALGVAVALGVGQIVDDVPKNLARRFKPERRRIAKMQFQDSIAFFLQPMRFFCHRAAQLVANILQLGGFANGAAFGGRERPVGFS